MTSHERRLAVGTTSRTPVVCGLRARIGRSIAQAGRYRPCRSSFAREWRDLAGPGSNPGMAGAVATMRLQGGDGDL